MPRVRRMARGVLSPEARTRWAAARRLLVVRLDAMGDVLMTTPAMRALRDAVPGRRIALLASSAGAAIAALVPEVDEIVRYEAPWMKASTSHDALPDLALVERLRAGRFDAAVVATVYTQSPLPAALLCHLAGIPLRLAHCRENPYQLLTDWLPEPEPAERLRHEVRRQLDLVAAVGAVARDERLSLAVPPDAMRRAAGKLRAGGVRLHEPWIALHPGATAASRRYPPEGFARAASMLAADGHQVVFVGGPADVPLVAEIRAAVRGRTGSVAGATSLDELAAVIAHAPVLLANNSGPVHLAAAVGTPVVDLYALTNPQHAPWNVPHRLLCHDVPCRWCYKSVCPEGHHDCLRRVPPEAVAAAVRELLASTPSDGRHPRGAAPPFLAC